jgi:hypothetical protein
LIIYALTEPDTGEIRYVGKTFRPAKRRLRRHVCLSNLKGNSHKERWIRKLVAAGKEPKIIVLQTCLSADELANAERFHIAKLRTEGARLTNTADGGDGGSGPHTNESKEKIRQALTGKGRSESHRINCGLASLGRKASPATRLKLSIMRRGKRLPPTHGELNARAKLTESQVEEIRSLAGAFSLRVLGRRFGVSKTVVERIQKGRLWKHLRVREMPAVLAGVSK